MNTTPFKIFAYLGARALGDSILFHVFCASVKRCFRNAQLTIYFQNDRPYKAPLAEMNPYIDVLFTSTKQEGPYLLDWFDIGWMPPFDFPTPDWQQRSLGNYDFLLLPSMMTNEAMASFEDPARLHFPEKQKERCHKRLIELGLNPNKWFCGLHIREEGYEFRKGTSLLKNISAPLSYVEMIQYTIEKLGGQVVRIGNASNTEFPRMNGFIDLSRVEDDFMLHAYASYRSRFFIGTDSGAYSIANAFGVPLGRTNVLSSPAGWNNFVSLTKTIVAPNGDRFRQEVADKAGLLTENLPPGYRLEENSPADLCRMVDFMYQMTTNQNGWRQHEPQLPPINPPNQFVWPRETGNMRGHQWL